MEFFTKLFKRRLEQSEKPEHLKDRLAVLIIDITNSFYINICRGLFEKDKLLFSFLIALKIKQNEGLIAPLEWQFFLRHNPSDLKVECPAYLHEKTWESVLALSQLNPWFGTLPDSMISAEDCEKWTEITNSNNPCEIALPEPFESRLDNYQKLLFWKIFREEKLIIAIRQYIKNELGEKFTESPGFDLKGSFADSVCSTPIIFVLSPGADPMVYLQDLAKECEMYDDRLKSLSLG